MPESVSLTTKDSWIIKGDYHAGNSIKGIILLPMMNHDRTSYDLLIPKFKQKGYHILAIDMRGHGESTNKWLWKQFSNPDFAGMENDVAEAKKFLSQKGVKDFYIIGASIGANIAMAYADKESSVKKIVLLSAGLDYHGVKTEAPASQFTRPLFIIASEGDEYSAESSQVLYNVSKSKNKAAELKIYPGSLHGTDLFPVTDLTELIIRFLEK